MVAKANVNLCMVFSKTVEVEEILMKLSFTDDLEWKVGEWGPCLVAENQILEYGIGLMQRNVSCTLNMRSNIDVSELWIIDVAMEEDQSDLDEGGLILFFSWV